MEGKKSNTVKEPDMEYGVYSYADYLTWQMEEVVELIKGKVFKKAAAAPKRIHQRKLKTCPLTSVYFRRCGGVIGDQRVQVGFGGVFCGY